MVGTPDEQLLLEPLRRLPAIRRLLEGPATRAELREELDVSRTTLHRVVTDLIDADVVVETDDGVALTPFGEEVAAAADAYAERVAAAERVAPLLNAVEPDDHAVEMPPEVFAHAEVLRPAPSQPQRPVQRVLDAIRAAEHIRSLAPVVLPSYVEAVYDVLMAGAEAELVVDPGVLDGLEESYTPELADALETGRVDLLVDDGLPFALLLTEETVCVVAHDEDGVLQGAVAGDDERLRSWAEECYEHYRSAAEWAAADVESGK